MLSNASVVSAGPAGNILQSRRREILDDRGQCEGRFSWFGALGSEYGLRQRAECWRRYWKRFFAQPPPAAPEGVLASAWLAGCAPVQKRRTAASANLSGAIPNPATKGQGNSTAFNSCLGLDWTAGEPSPAILTIQEIGGPYSCPGRAEIRMANGAKRVTWHGFQASFLL